MSTYTLRGIFLGNTLNRMYLSIFLFLQFYYVLGPTLQTQIKSMRCFIDRKSFIAIESGHEFSA